MRPLVPNPPPRRAPVHRKPPRPPAVRRQQGEGRALVRRLKNMLARVDHWAERLLPHDATALGSPEQRARPMIMLGMTLMFVLFGIIGLWSAVVPLAAGAIAPGRVVLEANRKEIQHLEGGIVKEILVREGEKVKTGQVLVRMDPTSAETRSGSVRGQYIAARAAEARLLAERDKKDTVVFADEMVKLEATDAQVRENMDAQRRLFQTRREGLEGQISVLNQKIAQSSEEIRGLREQASAANAQIAFLDEEIATVQTLLAKGIANKPRLLALQRQQAELVGQRGQAQAMVSRANQTINEAKIAILNQRTEFLNSVIAELKETQVQVATLGEQLRASSDIVRRVEVTAPIDGIVTGLAVHTVGGVIQPGDTLMALVPTGDRLIVEAQVSPQDIDVVHEGLEARVRLTAFKTRYMRPVDGKVINVSADRFEDQRTGQGYFLARIEIPAQELEDLGNLTLTPGMPAEALIVTGRRTMLSYLVRPIRDSFGRAFHEQ